MIYLRKIEEKINPWLFKEEIIILNGPRQVGKTSILKLIEQTLLKNDIGENSIFYLNLEDFDVLSALNNSPKNLLKYITNPQDKNYFLIDEIQYLDNPSNFLKYLYDEHREKVKIIATGSSSLEIKAKLQDSLVGRKIAFNVSPLDFEEFLIFKKSDILKYYGRNDVPEDIAYLFKNLLDEYLLYGGMPKVVLTENVEEKKQMLSNYVSDYINKDIRYIGKIDNILQFNHLVKALASQIGSLLNINELTNTLNVSRKHIELYISLLENTFVLNRILPYSTNIRSQISKMPKVYFFDTGVRNQILGNSANMENRTDSGNLFENFIYLELKNIFNANDIHFYRTTHQTEIDFMIEQDQILYPIEVKYSNLKKSLQPRAFSYLKKSNGVKVPTMYTINLNLSKKLKDSTSVPFFAIRKIF